MKSEYKISRKIELKYYKIMLKNVLYFEKFDIKTIKSSFRIIREFKSNFVNKSHEN